VRTLLAVVGGFVVSLGMFAAGLAAAIYLLAVDPVGEPGPSVDVADLWTAEPRRVDRAAQAFERLPALTASGEAQAAEQLGAAAAAGPVPGLGYVDATITGSVQSGAGAVRQDRLPAPQQGWERSASGEAEQSIVLDKITAAHVDWCASRYRSYRPENNSYTSFSGRQQPCVSPFTRDLAGAVDAEPALGAPPDRGAEAEFLGDADGYPAFVEEASALQYAVDDTAASDHASYCFSRYRSYRPQDNTYQPFGGGPRRQCR
jgi:hypothetical protein